ncbi:MAG: isochorismatase family protein [Elusimicrobiota bacterium]|jgi:nicotinamidase/pyrazinamidase|nr:isochorismatase family protein [Elusimicrobiota bacterium]
MKTLLVIDYQYDFYHPKGSLYCEGGEKILDKLTEFSKSPFFDLKIFTQDWHPKRHISFASTHNKEPFTALDGDILWPDHCVCGSLGAEIPKTLSDNADIIFRKGCGLKIDSYSAFRDKSGNLTPLQRFIREDDEFYICGIATDVCVSYTVKDLAEFCKNIFLVEDLCIGVTPQKHNEALSELAGFAKIIKRINK